MRSFFRSPYGVMMVVLAMYVLMIGTKIPIGTWVHSPMIAGDGYHNIADVFEAFLVIGAVFASRLPANGRYPLGRKNVESLASLGIGVGLSVMATKIGLKSWAGLLPWIDLPSGLQFLGRGLDAPEPLRMGPQYFWWVAGVTGGSTLLSLGVGFYQIRVGKRSGHSSVVNDGKETLSDASIEAVTFIGVCGQYQFDAPWLEYVLGLLVALLISRTAGAMIIPSVQRLLQHALPESMEQRIKELALELPGVERVESLKTFSVGDKAVIIVELISRCSGAANGHLHVALGEKLRAFLREQEIGDEEIYMRWTGEAVLRRRDAYIVAMLQEGEAMAVTSSVADGDHVLVVDVEGEEPVRITVHPKPSTLERLLELLRRKRVDRVKLFATNGVVVYAEELRFFERHHVMVEWLPSPDPVMLGLL